MFNFVEEIDGMPVVAMVRLNPLLALRLRKFLCTRSSWQQLQCLWIGVRRAVHRSCAAAMMAAATNVLHRVVLRGGRVGGKTAADERLIAWVKCSRSSLD